MKDQKIIKSGNSLVVTLPSSLVKSLGLCAGDLVKVETSFDQAQITYRFDSPRQLSLTPALRSPKVRHDKIGPRLEEKS